ncbi:MAG TPA: nuclear transport factor 2 family protein [Planctomycetota bacterium]|nr:nuclear transport factor 2 family protein [Planctomycetota bacterium]
MRSFRVASAVVLAVASCAAPRSDEAAPVRATVDRLIAADNLLDLERAMDCYTPDAVLLPPEGGPVRGEETIRARYATQFEAWRPELRVVHEETIVGAGEAVDRGRTLGKLHSTSGAPNKTIDDRYEARLRMENGAWRISELKWQPRNSPARADR